MRGGRCLLLLVAAAGCRGPSVATSPGVPMPSAVAGSDVLPKATPARIEPTADELPPSLDAKTADPAKLFAADASTFRGLTETKCAQLAARHSPTGDLLDQENAKPTTRIVPGGKHKKDCPDESSDQLARDVRFLAAVDARNRDAAEALERFFQLADAEGRTELLAAGLKSYDELRTLAPKFREIGLPVPADDELTRARSKLLGDIEAAEAGVRLLNVELQARTGQSVRGDERLWPVGPFPVSADPIDVEAAVQTALARRADLLLLRRLHQGLSAETLPAVDAALRNVNALAGSGPPTPGAVVVRRQAAKLTDQLRVAAAGEVAVRREQVFALAVAREKQAAAEVRAAAVQMASAARRVALAKGRAEGWEAKVEKAKRDGKAFDRLPLEVNWYKARAEVVQEVMAWHRWRAKLRAAQGEFGWAVVPADAVP